MMNMSFSHQEVSSLGNWESKYVEISLITVENNERLL